MEARKEYKFVLNSYELQNFLQIIDKSQEPLFNQRSIDSLYMDTVGYKLYKDSNSNDVDKFKVRYRQYDKKGSIFLETKYNKSTGRYKKSVEIKKYVNLDEVNNFFYHNLSLMPALKVSYTRNYIKYKNTRITIDKNLKFTSCKERTRASYSYESNLIVVEYKLLNNDSNIEKNFFKNPVSFSKYNYGLGKVYSIY